MRLMLDLVTTVLAVRPCVDALSDLNRLLLEPVAVLVSKPAFTNITVFLNRECSILAIKDLCETEHCRTPSVLDDLEAPTYLANWGTKANDTCIPQDTQAYGQTAVDLSTVPQDNTHYCAGAAAIWERLYDILGCDKQLSRLASGIHFAVAIHMAKNFKREDEEANKSSHLLFSNRLDPADESFDIQNVGHEARRFIQNRGSKTLVTNSISRFNYLSNFGVYEKKYTPNRRANLYYTLLVLRAALGRVLPSMFACARLPADVLDDINAILQATQKGPIFKATKKDLCLFEEVDTLLDCIECGTCRLWGKIQFYGLKTAIKLLTQPEDAVEGTDLLYFFHLLNKITTAVDIMHRYEAEREKGAHFYEICYEEDIQLL